MWVCGQALGGSVRAPAIPRQKCGASVGRIGGQGGGGYPIRNAGSPRWMRGQATETDGRQRRPLQLTRSAFATAATATFHGMQASSTAPPRLTPLARVSGYSPRRFRYQSSWFAHNRPSRAGKKKRKQDRTTKKERRTTAGRPVPRASPPTLAPPPTSPPTRLRHSTSNGSSAAPPAPQSQWRAGGAPRPRTHSRGAHQG